MTETVIAATERTKEALDKGIVPSASDVRLILDDWRLTHAQLEMWREQAARQTRG